jgi:hypothetical protein
MYRSDRAKARAAGLYLEAAGFRIISEAAEIGKNIFVEVRWQVPPSDNRTYEDLVNFHIALARKCVKSAIKLEVTPTPIGKHLLIPISEKRNPIGRPATDLSLRQQVKQFRNEGLSFPKIADLIREITGISRTPDAYRKLINNSR